MLQSAAGCDFIISHHDNLGRFSTALANHRRPKVQAYSWTLQAVPAWSVVAVGHARSTTQALWPTFVSSSKRAAEVMSVVGLTTIGDSVMTSDTLHVHY